MRTPSPFSLPFSSFFRSSMYEVCEPSSLFHGRRIVLQQLRDRLIQILLALFRLLLLFQGLGGLPAPDLLLRRHVIDVQIERADMNGRARGNEEAGLARGGHQDLETGE